MLEEEVVARKVSYLCISQFSQTILWLPSVHTVKTASLSLSISVPL